VQINEEVTAVHSALVNRWIEAFNRHDVAGIVALYADDAELFDTGMKCPRHGRNEIKLWFSKRFRTMPSITCILTGQFFAEEQVAIAWTTYGRTPRLLGQPWLSRRFQVDGVSVFTIQDGLIAKQRGYYDHLSVIEQIVPPLKWFLPTRL
jgi:steroid delta-isomerase-like uncharacterized protein